MISVQKIRRKTRRSYIIEAREFHLDGRRPLIGTARTMVMTTTTVPVRVNRHRGHQSLLSEVDLRSGDGGGDLDLRVGLRTVVDGRSRHCDEKEVCW